MQRFGVLIVAGLWSAGCGSHGPQKPPTSSNVSDKEQLPQEVHATDVTTTEYGPLPARERLFTIRSPNVTLKLGSSQVEKGASGRVTGMIYKHGLESTHFSADSANAEKSSPSEKALDVLVLQGHVAIRSLKPAGDLFCDRLRYDAETHVFRAKGHVHFSTSTGVVGTLPEAWATQDLSRIASPELFNRNL